MMGDSYDYEIIVFECVDQRKRELAKRKPAKFLDSPSDVRSIEQQIHASLHFVQKSLSEPDCLALGVGLTLIRHAARFRGNATTLSGTVTS